jgi:hypothetical protein
MTSKRSLKDILELFGQQFELPAFKLSGNSTEQGQGDVRGAVQPKLAKL